MAGAHDITILGHMSAIRGYRSMKENIWDILHKSKNQPVVVEQSDIKKMGQEIRKEFKKTTTTTKKKQKKASENIFVFLFCFCCLFFSRFNLQWGNGYIFSLWKVWRISTNGVTWKQSCRHTFECPSSNTGTTLKPMSLYSGYLFLNSP